MRKLNHYCQSHNNWGQQNGFQRILVLVYYWKTVGKPETDLVMAVVSWLMPLEDDGCKHMWSKSVKVYPREVVWKLVHCHPELRCIQMGGNLDSLLLAWKLGMKTWQPVIASLAGCNMLFIRLHISCFIRLHSLSKPSVQCPCMHRRLAAREFEYQPVCYWCLRELDKCDCHVSKFWCNVDCSVITECRSSVHLHVMSFLYSQEQITFPLSKTKSV